MERSLGEAGGNSEAMEVKLWHVITIIIYIFKQAFSFERFPGPGIGGGGGGSLPA